MTVVGRDEELALLGSALPGADRPRLVVGEAGVGKSALVRAVAERSGGSWVWGHTSSAGVGTLRPIVEVVGRAQRTAPGPSGTDGVARLLGAHATLGAVAAAEVLIDLLASTRDRIHVVVEDLHWADPDSLAILDVLVDRTQDAGCGLVMTSRDDELGPHRDLLDAWRDRRAVDQLALAPLGPEGVAQLVADRLHGEVDARAVEAIDGLSHGIPLRVTEFVEAFVDAGHLVRRDGRWVHEQRGTVGVPRSLRAHARRRLGILPAATADVIEAAALAGTMAVDVLTRMGFEPDQVLEAIDGGLATRLLEPADEPTGAVTFRHELTRGAVLGSMAGPRRAARAEALLDVLELDVKTEADLDACVELASQAGAIQRRAELVLRAASRAVDRGHARRALAVLDRLGPPDALDQDQRLRSGILACRAHGQVGDLAAARRLAAQVGPDLARIGDRVAAAQVALAVARAEGAAGDWPAAAASLRPFVDAPTGESGVDARVRAFAAVVAVERHHRDLAGALAAEARDLARQGDEGAAECEAIEVLGRITRDTDHEAAIAVFTSGVAVAEAHDLPLWRARALHERGLSMATLTTDGSGLTEAMVAAEEAGAMGLAATAALGLSVLAGYQFRSHEALAHAERSLELARRYRLGPLEARAQVMVGQAHAIEGRRGAARAAGAAALALAPDDPEVRGLSLGLCEGLASLLAEDVDAAFAELSASACALEELPFRTPSLPWYLWLIVSAVVDADGAGARAREIAAGDGMLEALVIPLRLAEAIAVGRRGQTAEAEEAAAEAEAEMDRFDLRAVSPGHMHLYLRHAGQAALEDGWGDPVRWLSEAAAALDPLGQRPVADRCRSLLREAGVVARRGRGRAPVPEPLAAAGVTARELEVLALLGQRLTNAQIADRLVIAPGTAKSHVERLLAKTGRRNRHELGELARDLDL